MSAALKHPRTAAAPAPAPAAQLADGVCAGERTAIARALNLIDDRRPSNYAARLNFLRHLPTPESVTDSHLVGLTGPPGAGKSTLISALIAHWRSNHLRVGVLAADPTSPLSGGALLGDRLRMQADPDDNGIFIRSLASRASYGGLAAELLPMAAVMLAAFDRVIVETVGVGQREIDVAFTVDTTCVAVQPGSGDSVQFLKAGIMEIPDVLVVTKGDLGSLASSTCNELRGCVDTNAIPVLLTSALDNDGIGPLADALSTHHQRLKDRGEIASKRIAAQTTWLLDRLQEEFGYYGISALGGRDCVLDLLKLSRCPLLARHGELRQRAMLALRGASTHGDTLEPLTY
ncbi:MAG: LAO/AO transport system kinase [Gammaproteobacteria bacterium]